MKELDLAKVKGPKLKTVKVNGEEYYWWYYGSILVHTDWKIPIDGEMTIAPVAKTITVKQANQKDLIKKLKAKMPKERPEVSSVNGRQYLDNIGFNQALAEVNKIIENLVK